MIVIGLIDIRFWRMVAPLAYGVSLVLLIAVDIMGGDRHGRAALDRPRRRSRSSPRR